MAYTIISQNNNTTTLSDGVNTITVPSRVNLTSGNFTIVEVNNNMATLEDGDGNVYRDIPCVATLAGEGGGGAVSSVNGKTGAVVLNAGDVDAVPQYSSMPEPNQAGDIVQYTGTTSANYTNGYFYKSTATGSDIVSGTATVTEYINGEGNTPSVIPTFIFDKSVFDAYLVSQSEPENTGTTVTFSWEADDETGDTYLVATYNTNDKVHTELQGETGSLLNDSYAVLGFTTDFLDWDDPDTGTEAVEQHIGTLGHITVSLPTENIYGWERIDVQPAPVIPDPLPSQTGNSGKFLTTDGTDASWGDALTNMATQTSSLAIGMSSNITQYHAVVMGKSASATSDMCIAIGEYAKADGTGAISICASDGGYTAKAYSIIIGGTTNPQQYQVRVGKTYGYNYEPGYGSIVLGSYQFDSTTNAGSGEFWVCPHTKPGMFDSPHAYKLLDSDGTIPTARLTKVNTTATLTSAGWSGGSQTVTVNGVTATGIVFVSPDPTDQSAYTSAGILCTAQAAGTLTFTCDTVPSADIDVNVVML